MTTDKMREEFEAAVIERFKESGFLEVEIRTEMLVRDGDDYYDSSVSTYWHFWKASRAAVVVELPAFTGYVDYIVRELQASFRQQAEAAGLQVAP